MKKWLRRSLIFIAVIGLVTGGLYEYATHVGRGWLRGEAFFQGRPTSFWHAEINGWVERFDRPEDAENWIELRGLRFSQPARKPRPTFLSKACGYLRLAAEITDESSPPSVLCGNADAEPVLREMEDDPALQRFVHSARRRARLGELLPEVFFEMRN